MPCHALRRPVRIGVHVVAALLAWLAAGAVSTAAAAPGGATRTLDVKIEGRGAVRSADGRIDCAPRCATSYRRGRVVTLIPTPGRYFEFRAWTAGCRGRAPTCVIAMDKATTVRAYFRRKIGEIRVVVGGAGGIYSPPLRSPCSSSPERRFQCAGVGCATGLYSLPGAGGCVGSFLQGIPVRLRPVPAPGAVFYAWNGVCRGAPPDHCDVVPENLSEVSATFRAAVPTPGDQLLTVTTGLTSLPLGIDCPPSCSATFASGTVVTLRIRRTRPADFTGDCTGRGTYCTLVVDGPLEVGEFPGGAFKSFGVNVSVSGPGRVVEPAKQINCTRGGKLSACQHFFLVSSVIVLEARPDRGARFVGWRNSPACLDKKATRCRLKVNGKKDLTAVFARR